MVSDASLGQLHFKPSRDQHFNLLATTNTEFQHLQSPVLSLDMSNQRKHLQNPSKWVAFLKDDSGVSTIEFAFVAPFLIGLLLFVVSANDVVNSSTEIGKVTVTVADILSQSSSISAEFIDGTFDAADLIVNANRRANLELYVAGVEIFTDGTAEVLWSRDNGNLSTITKPSPGENYDLPPELLQRAGFIVSVRARMRHTHVAVRSGFGGQKATLFNMPLIKPLLEDTPNYDYESNFIPRSSIRTTCSNCSN